MNCVICLQNDNDVNKITTYCNCRIVYHDDCLKQWYNTQHRQECPICHKINIQLKTYENAFQLICKYLLKNVTYPLQLLLVIYLISSITICCIMFASISIPMLIITLIIL